MVPCLKFGLFHDFCIGKKFAILPLNTLIKCILLWCNKRNEFFLPIKPIQSAATMDNPARLSACFVFGVNAGVLK